MSATTTTTAPPAPRPRLVAKSASGQQASAPKASGSGYKNGGKGPDPMQVWNKNRGMTRIGIWCWARINLRSCTASTTKTLHR